MKKVNECLLSEANVEQTKKVYTVLCEAREVMETGILMLNHKMEELQELDLLEYTAVAVVQSKTADCVNILNERAETLHAIIKLNEAAEEAQHEND